jgi:hypothetical protein
MNQPTTPELAYEEGLRLLALVERVNASKLTSPAARGRAVKDIARQASLSPLTPVHLTRRCVPALGAKETSCPTLRLGFMVV